MGIDYQDENNIGWYLLAAAIVREQVNDLSNILFRIHSKVIQGKKIKIKRYINFGRYKGLFVQFDGIGEKTISADAQLKFFQSEWCKYLSLGTGADQLIDLAIYQERKNYFLKYLRDKNIYSQKEMQIHAQKGKELPIRTRAEWQKLGYKVKAKEQPYKELIFYVKDGEIHWRKTGFYLKEQVKKYV